MRKLKARECGGDRSKVKTHLLQRFLLLKFHVIEAPNARGQIAFYAIHSFLAEVQANTGYMHLRLGLPSPLVDRIYLLFPH